MVFGWMGATAICGATTVILMYLLSNYFPSDDAQTAIAVEIAISAVMAGF
jgi:hypothetical protein